jgi:hypothetical protein
MDGAGEDFCNDGMIAVLKYSNQSSVPYPEARRAAQSAFAACQTSLKQEVARLNGLLPNWI